MNTYQLSSVLHTDQAVGPSFLGVFPIDKLPPVPINNHPYSLIVNFDKSSQPGSHWVALYVISETSCEYFDSYGREPPQLILKFINNQRKKLLRRNTKCLQSTITSTCGQMCIFYLVWRLRNVPMCDIVDSLDMTNGDELVTKFVNGLFKIKTKIIDEKFLANQFSKTFLEYKG
jgi:Adenovirus endoprotease